MSPASSRPERWGGDPQMLADAVVLAVEFLVWWVGDGTARHGKGTRAHRLNTTDYLLRHFALRAVQILGGWQNARLVLKGWVPDEGVRRRPAPTRGIRIRPEHP